MMAEQETRDKMRRCAPKVQLPSECRISHSSQSTYFDAVALGAGVTCGGRSVAGGGSARGAVAVQSAGVGSNQTIVDCSPRSRTSNRCSRSPAAIPQSFEHGKRFAAGWISDSSGQWRFGARSDFVFGFSGDLARGQTSIWREVRLFGARSDFVFGFSSPARNQEQSLTP